MCCCFCDDSCLLCDLLWLPNGHYPSFRVYTRLALSALEGEGHAQLLSCCCCGCWGCCCFCGDSCLLWKLLGLVSSALWGGGHTQLLSCCCCCWWVCCCFCDDSCLLCDLLWLPNGHYPSFRVYTRLALSAFGGGGHSQLLCCWCSCCFS